MLSKITIKENRKKRNRKIRYLITKNNRSKVTIFFQKAQT